jgi:DNA processing protein
MQPGATFKRLAELFRKHPGATPLDLVDIEQAQVAAKNALAIIQNSEIGSFGIRLYAASQYPERLRDAAEPVELLYFQGAWELTEIPKAIAIVGSRKPSPEAVAETRELARSLIEMKFLIVSGLASGIDTAAHRAALEFGGRTIAVIGTPITDVYPKQNAALQRTIAAEHLVISQIPLLRYRSQDWRRNRSFFPERNKTMSALTQATVIVEASDTSGTLIQAKAALQQKRTLFIMDRCFHRASITWPKKFIEQGAIRVRDTEDIKWALDAS